MEAIGESQLEVKSTGEFVDGSEVRRLGQNARASVASLWGSLGVPWGFPKSESQISPGLGQVRKEEPRKT